MPMSQAEILELNTLLDKYNQSIRAPIHEIEQQLMPLGSAGAGSRAITDVYNELKLYSLSPDARTPSPISPTSPSFSREESVDDKKGGFFSFRKSGPPKSTPDTEEEIALLKKQLKSKLGEAIPKIKRAELLIAKLDESIAELNYDLEKGYNSVKAKDLELFTALKDKYEEIMPSYPFGKPDIPGLR